MYLIVFIGSHLNLPMGKARDVGLLFPNLRDPNAPSVWGIVMFQLRKEGAMPGWMLDVSSFVKPVLLQQTIYLIL